MPAGKLGYKKKNFFFASFQSLKKGVGSGVGSVSGAGSISQIRICTKISRISFSNTAAGSLGQWFAQTHHFNKDPDPLYRDADPQHRLRVDVHFRCLTSFFFSRSVSGPITIPAQQQIILIPKPVQKVQTVIRYANVYKQLL